MKKRIATQAAPAAIGPYSQAVAAGNLVFVSGQLGINPQTGILEDGIQAQTRGVFHNLQAILQEAGLTFDDVIKTTVFLADINDFALVNKIYSEYIKGDVLPARSCVQVAVLPKKALIEIDVIAGT